ncbi:helix-turn-helix transcriptional regulator [Clostridiaceae bacterium NSJ-31]|uniref:Helix-turn-helix transcriptional regulator n=1 Tax=Ligaoa zhengdingensis TaxID=2763658 RepID=A0A926DYL5_9FIRM|nr:helix-turn-helix transcriptional regulator [Ligaoa zhengdingensis]
MFYDLFYSLCVKKGVSPSKACLDMGLSRSLAAKWKNTKATPSADAMSKIANYFGVTVDYLLGIEQKKSSTEETAEDRDAEIRAMLHSDKIKNCTAVIMGFEGDGQKVIELSEEEYSILKKMVEALRNDK